MKLPSKRRDFARFVGFVAAGGAATVLNYGVFLGLFTAGVYYTLASMVGYVSGIAVSYLINVTFVFRNNTHRRGLLRSYVLVYIAALGVQLALLETFVRSGFSPEISNAVAIALVVVANFFVMSKFVFPVADDKD